MTQTDPGHGSATMTMDLYGHLVEQNIWEAARRVGDWTGTVNQIQRADRAPEREEERG